MTASSKYTDIDIGNDEIPQRPHRAHTLKSANEPGKFELGGAEKTLPEDAGLHSEQGVRRRCNTS